jgi:hypothetical protein
VPECDLEASKCRWPSLCCWTDEWLRATSDYESVNEWQLSEWCTYVGALVYCAVSFCAKRQP